MRITGPRVDVNERSEPARLFQLRFIRLLHPRTLLTCSSEMLAKEMLEVIKGEHLVRGKQDEAVRRVEQLELGTVVFTYLMMFIVFVQRSNN